MSDRRVEKSLEVRWQAYGKSLDDLGLAMQGYRSYMVGVTGFSVRGPQENGGDFLVTVRGLDEEGAPVVAFHGAPELGEALRGVDNRLANGTLRWRPDEYARGR